jgi:hypothetical protein
MSPTRPNDQRISGVSRSVVSFSSFFPITGWSLVMGCSQEISMTSESKGRNLMAFMIGNFLQK